MPTGFTAQAVPLQLTINDPVPAVASVEDAVAKKPPQGIVIDTAASTPLWQLNIVELTGHNLEARGREEVNRLLKAGWCLLHIYTLKYREDDVWRERPMAILGKPRKTEQIILPQNGDAYGDSAADHISRRRASAHRRRMDSCRSSET